jgi:hypothetical protein
LRAHVGELVGNEAESAFKAVDDLINQLVGEKQGLQTRIDELEALLDQRYTPPAPRASGKTVSADVAAAEAADKEARKLAAPSVPEKSAPAPEKPAPAPGKPAPAVEKAAPAPTPAPTPAPAAGQAKPADNSFDELAFLNTVVGQDGASESLVAKSRRDAALVVLGDRVRLEDDLHGHRRSVRSRRDPPGGTHDRRRHVKVIR